MLLEHQLLAVAKTWLYREKIEREAAADFSQLARQLEALGAPPTIVSLAGQAQQDEFRHAALCRAIVERLAPGLEPLYVEPTMAMGPSLGSGLTPAQSALYASIALSCVTETLSTALLVEMRAATNDEQIHATIHGILKDEINHSRIGWAHLAWEAGRSDVSWLGGCLPAMIRAALNGAANNDGLLPSNAAEWGILAPERSRAIVNSTFRDVIFPGMELYRIDTGAARDMLA